MTEFAVNIGLEVHIQLNSQSKAFCADSILFGQAPNTQISPISLAYPGTLPKINEAQIKKAVQLALAVDSEIREVSYFDRKSYFYPDLPKGYQLTQDNAPYCKGGHLDIIVGETLKRVAIHHIHMEEDAGKSIHTLDPKNSMIDLNRAGTPLLELVTDPCLETAEEAYQFLSRLRSLIRYLGISDGNMEQGSMRADCNVSIRPKVSTKLGERCEVKNVNSLRFAKKAIDYEINRQTKVIKAGGTIRQTTMDFDADKGVTRPLRDKEDVHDYRYFPDPDLPPLVLTKKYIQEVRAAMPVLPWEIENKMIEEHGISQQQAQTFAYDPELRSRFQEQLKLYPSAKKLANLYSNKIIPYIQSEGVSIKEMNLLNDQICGLLQLIDNGEVSSSKAYQLIFPELMKSDESPRNIAQRLDLIMAQSSDAELETLFKTIFDDNSEKVKAYQSGKKGLLGFFMGQAMKASGGKLNPKKAKDILQRMLDNQ
ncbi:MAG: Asp-tRNA(Asn)/Glu-tRNA(Gln) amidotransferase subunit GatB [Bacteroidia bacterium]|nr:Asp-tRNA(Asn)/Glu-tRNA(Gln) amidotransferase subunit GatB [Bacteroidia bacterium]